MIMAVLTALTGKVALIILVYMCLIVVQQTVRINLMVYIQRKGDGYLETVDEFETMKEAKEMVKEYRMSDTSADYYISQRACKAWSER